MKRTVLLVEDDTVEALLLRRAVVQSRAAAEVLEPRDPREVCRQLRAAGLVIVGWKTLLDLASGELRNLVSLARFHGVPVVGFADEMAEFQRRQALLTGVSALYNIPMGADAYRAAVDGILDAWLFKKGKHRVQP